MEIVIGDSDSDGGVWFTPDFADNRELPVEKQARVKVLPMTGRDKLKLDHASVIRTKSQTKQKDVLAAVYARNWKIQENILLTRVIGLENWTRRRKTESGEVLVEKIETPKDWIDTILAARNVALSAVLEQVYQAILDASTLEEGLAGEFDSPHDSP